MNDVVRHRPVNQKAEVLGLALPLINYDLEVC